jgi:hypothetical protein
MQVKSVGQLADLNRVRALVSVEKVDDAVDTIGMREMDATRRMVWMGLANISVFLLNMTRICVIPTRLIRLCREVRCYDVGKGFDIGVLECRFLFFSLDILARSSRT